MTRLLVTGAGGMLGRDLVTVLHARSDLKVTAATRADLDVTDPAAVRDVVGEHDLVINTAAWTNVDGAEADEAAATAVNGTGVANLASACAASGARLIQVSTDYVLAGDARIPYPEDAPTAPVNAYGRGKLVGEQAVARLLPDTGYVVRTAWLYGAHGPNFVATMLRLAEQRQQIDVVDDQHGQPTWSYRLAEQLVALADSALEGRATAGVYHSTCAGQTTWYGLARAVFTLAGLDPDRIQPTTSDRYPRPAPRPAYSVLAHSRWAAAGLPSLPDWHATLVDAFDSPAPPAPWKVA
ncbi:dTDP-4-dehydrorhamnose reductase [Micromonospora zamorensis]|uniref:dTDP-4-dehydrorhamnose reductase n=1 Tax=Micromonospora zamorensis TaxID=709883 RepID=UPI003D8E6868